MNQQVSDIMTTKVVTISADQKVDEIARVLLEKGISAVPVADENGKVLGIVSEGDLLRRHENHTERRHSSWLSLFTSSEDDAREYAKTHGMTASQVMSSDIISVNEDTLVGDIAQLLEKRRIKRVPVVRDGRLVGIVSRANLLHGLVALAPPHEVQSDDRQIRETLSKTLVEDLPSVGNFVSYVVRDGTVQLWGGVLTESEKTAVRVAAEGVPGVRGVEDNVTILPSALQVIGTM